jgi:hypothetical protein
MVVSGPATLLRRGLLSGDLTGASTCDRIAEGFRDLGCQPLPSLPWSPMATGGTSFAVPNHLHGLGLQCSGELISK